MTRGAWDDTNSTGNTMSNFWGDYEADKIANIYCRAAKPNNKVCKKYYSISEKDIFNGIFKLNHQVGLAFDYDGFTSTYQHDLTDIKNEERIYGFFRKNTSIIALWGQELLWAVGNWRNEKLNHFLDEFKPDIIFSSCFAPVYTHRLLWYIQQRTKAKVVLFHADDYLSVNNVGGSLLTRINQRLRSKVIKKSALRADLNYCISPKQKNEYTTVLKKEMKLLYKGADFNLKVKKLRDHKTKLFRIVYLGNTLYGRWETLGMLAQSIYEINKKKPTFELLIYSQYIPSDETMQTMVIEGASKFMGKVAAKDVPEILTDSDIVLHVESFEKTERLKTRLSFSTKIVDCLNSGNCVFAIGWEEAASIEYLKQNDAALVAHNQQDIIDTLDNIWNNPEIIAEYADKAWECGRKNHQIKKIRNKMADDFENLISESI